MIVKILIIEDNYEVANILREFLTLHGNKCEVALNYDNALLHLETFYDIVIADILLMGNKTGLDFISEYKKIHPMSFTIVITGHKSLRNTVESADLFLEKPIDFDKLLEVININSRTSIIEIFNRISEDIREIKNILKGG